MKILLIILAYLIGSINTAYIIGKFKGVDIRKGNSHNPGAGNIKLHFGWKFGILTWFFDTLKVIITFHLIKAIGLDLIETAHLGALMAVLGHCFSIFLGFQGGKGFSSYGGLVLSFSPISYLIAMPILLLIGYISNSLACLTLVALFIGPLLLYINHASNIAILIAVIASMIVGYRHLDNFKSLFNGTELKLFER